MHRVFHLVWSTMILVIFSIALVMPRPAMAQEDKDLDVIEAEIKLHPAPKKSDEAKSIEKTSENKSDSANLPAETKIETLSDLSRLAPFSEVSILQKRYMPKTNRFQFYGGIATNMNDPWNLGVGFNGRFTYGFTEAWGIEATGTIISSSKKEVAKDLYDQHGLDTTVVVTMKNYMGLNVMWTPYYGKMTLFNQRIIPFDHYFTFGAGTAALDGGQTSSTTAIQFGTGQIFALTRSLAFRWDLSVHSYTAKQQDSASGTFNNILLTMGASFYIPEAKYR